MPGITSNDKVALCRSRALKNAIIGRAGCYDIYDRRRNDATSNAVDFNSHFAQRVGVVTELIL